MIRALLAGILLIGLYGPALRGEEPRGDVVRAQLDQAKKVYAESLSRHQVAVDAWFEKREANVRRLGKLDELGQFKVEREAFATTGELPKDAPAALKTQAANARSALQAAYRTAIRAYVKVKLDQEAAALETELKNLDATKPRPSDVVEFQGKKYRVYDEVLTWSEAKTKCEEMGGHLAVAESQKKNEFLKNLLSKSGLTEVWLGATDEKKEGEWRWVTGPKMDFHAWANGQPNNKEGVEHYMVLIVTPKSSGWSDQPDKSLQHNPGFICEWD